MSGTRPTETTPDEEDTIPSVSTPNKLEYTSRIWSIELLSARG